MRDNPTSNAGSLNGRHIGQTISFKDENGDTIIGKLSGVKRAANYLTNTLYMDAIGAFVVNHNHEVEIRSNF